MDFTINTSSGVSGRILYEKFPINLLSILANILVIVLSFQNKEIAKFHFRYFIANTAILGACFSTVELTEGIALSLVHIFDWKMGRFFCTVPRMISHGSSGTLLWTYAMTMWCRYREIVNFKECTKFGITLRLVLPYVMGCSGLFLYYVVLSSGYVEFQREGRACADMWMEAHVIIQILLHLHPSIPLWLLIYLSLRLYRFLKYHFKHVTSNVASTRTSSCRLAEEKSILRAILIQGISPIFLSFPVFAVYLYGILNGWPAPAAGAKLQQIIGLDMYDLAEEIFALNPLVDATSILFIVISYKKARKQMLSSFRVNFNCC